MTHASGAAAFQPPFRSRKVLDHARGQPCTLRLPRFCNRNAETTVSAHIRDRHKGMAQKASDHSVCFACSGCHAALDEGRWIGVMDEADVLRCVIRGLQETWEILIADGIVGFPHDKPKSFHSRPPKPRKPKGQRAKVPAGRKLAGRSEWPKGRKMPSRKVAP